MIGGYGADRLVGNSGDDILIAGYTAHDSNYAALDSLMAEWNSAPTYSLRVAHLRGTTGGGLNGTDFRQGRRRRDRVRLWINQRNGTFAEDGLLRAVAVNAMGDAQANMGVAWGDVDGDGLCDPFATH